MIEERTRENRRKGAKRVDCGVVAAWGTNSCKRGRERSLLEAEPPIVFAIEGGSLARLHTYARAREIAR